MLKKFLLKKYVIVFIVMLLSVSTYSMASDVTIPNSMSSTEKESKKQQVLGQITEYLDSDIQTEGKVIELSDMFTDLYDIDGIITGYMIPLISKNKEIGYVSISILNNNCIVQEIFIEDNATKNSKTR